MARLIASVAHLLGTSTVPAAIRAISSPVIVGAAVEALSPGGPVASRGIRAIPGDVTSLATVIAAPGISRITTLWAIAGNMARLVASIAGLSLGVGAILLEMARLATVVA
jgi:hypothetical protein